MTPGTSVEQNVLDPHGYDSAWLRAALTERGITACIPSTRSPKVALPYSPVLYRQRHRIEDAFGRLKGWRRFATRYDRCAHTFFSAICITAAVTFWLRQRVLSIGAATALLSFTGR